MEAGPGSAGGGSGSGGAGGTVAINGGTVTAAGGAGNGNGGAGIGGGGNAGGGGNTVNISGGTIEATGGDGGDTITSVANGGGGGAGIGGGGGDRTGGGGAGGDSGDISITGSADVTTKGGGGGVGSSTGGGGGIGGGGSAGSASGGIAGTIVIGTSVTENFMGGGGGTGGSLNGYAGANVGNGGDTGATTAEAIFHTITATAGAGGTISPSGAVKVSDGGNITFTITPDSGYGIASVKVDGANNPAAVSSGSYPFSNVIIDGHTIAATFASSAKDITAFTIAGVNGTITDGTPNKITLTVPYGTNLVGLTPSITVSADASVSPASGLWQDFSGGPVTYTVTAQDGSTKQYVVTVMAAMNPAKSITSFTLAGATGTIDEGAGTIAVTVPFGTDVTSLTPVIVTTGAYAIPAGAQDFTHPVPYTVTAEDASTKTYTVTVTVAAPITPTITTTALDNGTVGAAYSQTLASTSTTPITWSLDTGSLPLPDGLSLNASTGEISGTPTTAGTFNFTVKATNGAGSVTRNFSLTVEEATPNASIDYVREKLTGLVADAGYNIGGVDKIADTSGETDIDPAWIGNNALQVIKTNSNPYCNSDAQSLDVPARPAAPNVTATAGGISGTTTQMQYSADNVQWTDCSAGSTALPPGTYYVRLKATAGSFTGEAATVTVNKATPTLTINGLNSSYTYGDASFTIATTGGAGAGAVTFASSDPSVATVVNHSDNTASVTILNAGLFTITATKAADGNYNEASVISGTVTVNKATPNVTLSATGGTYSDNAVVLAATVSPIENGVMPTGAVTFKEGDTTLGTADFDNSGTATYVVPALIDPGNYTYTAAYSGDDNYNAGSATTTVDVTPYLSVSPNELNFSAAGETKTFNVICNTYWTLGNDAPWLTISTGDDGAMLITATANPTADQRFALISIGIADVTSQSIAVTQDGNGKTAIEAVGAPSVIVYSQNGDVIVKSDVPVQSVAVYDVSGKMLKQAKGGSNLITISGLPKNQVLIVRVTSDERQTVKNIIP